MREYVESLIVAIIIALVLRTFVVAAYKIPTASMAPTLKVGDCIFAWKLPYGLRIPFLDIQVLKPRMPQRGDVVVFRYPDDETLSFIKRVVGIPGDKIEIRQKRLIINDKLVAYGPARAEDVKDLPLQELYIVQSEVLDGKSHSVMYRRGEDEDSFGPQVVPEGRFFVLGDNRDSSDDSRFWGTKGMVPIENLEGRAVLIWASFDWEKRLKNIGLPKVRTERLLSVIR
jgi:signal peptidase I